MPYPPTEAVSHIFLEIFTVLFPVTHLVSQSLSAETVKINSKNYFVADIVEIIFCSSGINKIVCQVMYI